MIAREPSPMDIGPVCADFACPHQTCYSIVDSPINTWWCDDVEDDS